MEAIRMKAYFDIYQACTEIDRPPISHKVRGYFIQFITEKILIQKKIIVNSKWNVVMGIIFVGEGERFKSTSISLPKGGVRTIKENAIKLYEILIPIKAIQEANDVHLKTLELIYETLKIPLTTIYKKVSPALMDELWNEVDLSYLLSLLSLPYPAPLSEQMYVGDSIGSDGKVKVV